MSQKSRVVPSAVSSAATGLLGALLLGPVLSAPLALGLAAQTAAAPLPATPNEVRQLVTFLFQPGRTGDALAIYEQQLKPIYAGVVPLLRFRGYREVESPEPLDLVIVSSYRGMSGMDEANDALRAPGPDGTSAFALYGTLSGMTQHHHDQFVEILPELSDSSGAEGALTIFEYLRVPPGAHAGFETLVAGKVRALEQSRRLSRWSETGRMLVSDGWDYLRIHRMDSLGDWQRHQTAMRALEPFAGSLVAARKVIVLRMDGRLSVR